MPKSPESKRKDRVSIEENRVQAGEKPVVPPRTPPKDVAGPSLEDLEQEARTLWEEDPELAAMLGIELTGLAGVHKKKILRKKGKGKP